jgi:hypothetical protein
MMDPFSIPSLTFRSFLCFLKRGNKKNTHPYWDKKGQPKKPSYDEPKASFILNYPFFKDEHYLLLHELSSQN